MNFIARFRDWIITESNFAYMSDSWNILLECRCLDSEVSQTDKMLYVVIYLWFRIIESFIATVDWSHTVRKENELFKEQRLAFLVLNPM